MYRFSLKFLFASVFVVSCLLAYCGNRIEWNSRLKNAFPTAAWSIVRSSQLNSRGLTQQLREAQPFDIFYDVSSVSYFGASGGSLTCDQLEIFSELSELRTLYLRGVILPDDYVERFNFPRLTHLDLSCTAISGRSLTCLSKSKNLRELIISRTDVRDIPPGIFERLDHLEFIDASDTRVSDTTLAEFAQASRVRALELARTPLSETGLATICAMPSLEQLTIDSTLVGDRGCIHLVPTGIRLLAMRHTRLSDSAMEFLSQMSKLENLDLTGTQVGDEGLMCLARSNSINHLVVTGTNVTPEGIKEFQRARPHCHVVR